MVFKEDWAGCDRSFYYMGRGCASGGCG